LIETIGSADVRQRGERLDQFAFGQRLGRAAGAAADRDRADAQLAIRSFPRDRMLLVTLERIGVRAPAVYAAAVRHAARLSGVEGRRAFLLHAQFQGALALVDRAAAVRTFAPAAAEALVTTLVAVPVTADARYAGAVAAWLRESFLRAAPPAPDADSAVIAALSGGPSADAARAATLTWEGEQYRLDLGAAERQRLRDVREKQEAVSLDAALGVAAEAQRLLHDPSSAASVLARLGDLVDRVPRQASDRDSESPTAGIPSAPPHREQLKKAIDDIGKAARAKDAKRAARAADTLVDVGDDMLASALLSFAYAIHVGVRDADIRQKTPWATPREEVLPNVPWHVTGSLLGLDIALAPLALRRISTEGVLEAPRLIAPEREAFALSVSLLNPYGLRDADRDAIADAIARGTRRVQAMDLRTVDVIADELSLDGTRRRALRWAVAPNRSARGAWRSPAPSAASARN